MGYDEQSARGLIRVSLGRFNTRQQVLQFVKILKNVVAEVPGPHAIKTSAAHKPVQEHELESLEGKANVTT
jgi:hypothetical protein